MEAYRVNPNSVEANMVMGSYKWRNEEFEKAYEYFKKSVEINPNNFDGITNMADFMVDRGLCNLAFQLCDKLVDLDPSRPARYTNRAYIGFSCLGNYEEAEIDFQIALEIDPTLRWTLGCYSEFLIRIKQYVKAKKYCFEWIKADSNAKFPQAFIHAVNGYIDSALFLTNKFPYPESPWTDRFKKYIYIILDEQDSTYKYLKRESEGLYEVKSSIYPWLKNDPIYDEFRDDPRFKEILEKHKELYEENLVKYGDLIL
jgi:tetratricopeptide (TPR) repeat protein